MQGFLDAKREFYFGPILHCNHTVINHANVMRNQTALLRSLVAPLASCPTAAPSKFRRSKSAKASNGGFFFLLDSSAPGVNKAWQYHSIVYLRHHIA